MESSKTLRTKEGTFSIEGQPLFPTSSSPFLVLKLIIMHPVA